MRLGLVTYNLAAKWDLETLIHNCEETGFEGVELRATHAHGVEPSLSKAERERIKKRFKDTEVQLVQLGSACEFHSPDRAELERNLEEAKSFIQLAHDVGAAGVKVRPNDLPKNVPAERTIEQIGKALREIGAVAADAGVEIRVEVHGWGTQQVPTFQQILAIADHPAVTACWNSNPADLDDGGFDDNFDRLASRIGLVHINELWNNYPWRHLLRRLTEVGYDGFCMCEILESPDALRLMRYYRALFLAYLDRK